MARRDSNEEKMDDVFKKLSDIGDFIGVKGYIFTTKVGEVSLHVSSFQILTKSQTKEKKLSKKSLEFAKKMGAQSLICVPIVYENESLGILAVDNLGKAMGRTC